MATIGYYWLTGPHRLDARAFPNTQPAPSSKSIGDVFFTQLIQAKDVLAQLPMTSLFSFLSWFSGKLYSVMPLQKANSGLFAFILASIY